VTLFCVWIVSDFLHVIVGHFSSFLSVINLTLQRFLLFSLAISLLLVYQWFLSQAGGSVWLLDGSNREINWIHMNKEGLCSLPGYLALYLLTEWLSATCIFSSSSSSISPQETNETRNKEDLTVQKQQETVTTNDKMKKLKRFVMYTIGLFALWVGLHTYIQSTSRRLCNVSYVTLVLALAWLMLTLFFWLETILLPWLGYNTKLLILSNMNTQSLYVFLVANVMTGMVNMLIPTLYASTLQTMTIMIVYTFILTMISGYMGEIVSLLVQFYQQVLRRSVVS